MLLQQLSEAAGISGQEDAVRDILLEAITPHVTDIRVDAMGNLLAVQRGTDGENRPRVMLAAHMDEVGFMVTGYDSDGMLQFDSVGGIDDRILAGKRVRVGADGLPGVILWTPIHKNRDQNVVKMSSLRIDIGASSKGDAQGKAPMGTMVVFDSSYGEHGNLLRGKAFDDRVGCAVLVDVLANGPYPADVLVAFTVQEEVGLRGAIVAARTLQPDMAFSLECTTAFDVPDPHADPDEVHSTPNPTTRLGAGPALTLMDRSVVVPPAMVDFMRDTAEAEGIPYQFKTRRGGGNDAGTIQLQNGGVPAATISVPARYIHSPAALIDMADYDATVKLVGALLRAVEAVPVMG
ncbi:MAG: M42 family metallopeptidase [Chloroflexota bacterium]